MHPSTTESFPWIMRRGCAPQPKQGHSNAFPLHCNPRTSRKPGNAQEFLQRTWQKRFDRVSTGCPSHHRNLCRAGRVSTGGRQGAGRERVYLHPRNVLASSAASAPSRQALAACCHAPLSYGLCRLLTWHLRRCSSTRVSTGCRQGVGRVLAGSGRISTP